MKLLILFLVLMAEICESQEKCIYPKIGENQIIFQITNNYDTKLDKIEIQVIDDNQLFEFNFGKSFILDISPGETKDCLYSYKMMRLPNWTEKQILIQIASDSEVLETLHLKLINLSIPNHLVLEQNYPNPFNPTTHIVFSIPANNQDNVTKLTIYNLEGKVVSHLIDEILSAGVHSIQWDGKNDRGEKVATGVYLCKLINGNNSEIIKLSLIK